MPASDLADSPEPDVVGLVLIAVLGAALSLAVTGFKFGLSNNLFHLPIIGMLYNEPQFRDDAFMQSLRFFAAGPFQLLRGIDRHIDPSSLFLVLAYFSRLLSFLGFLACARLLGLGTRRDRLVFATLLSFTSLLHGVSFAGGGGLFIDYFSHSEIANGLSLIAIYLAARGKVAAAFAANGTVFFANAFVAVWNAAPLGLIIGLLLMRRCIGLSRLLVQGSIGLAAFAALAVPVVANVLSNPDFGVSTPFDYRAFLAEYWPFHFLFDGVPARQKIGLAATIAVGGIAFYALARRADVFQAALGGYVLVYVVGIIAPAVTGSAAVLNLHLLRSSSGIHLMAALGGLALVTVWLASHDPHRSRVFGPSLAVTLCTVKSVVVLAPFVTVAALLPMLTRWAPGARLRGVLLGGTRVFPLIPAALLLIAWSSLVWKNTRQDMVFNQSAAAWQAIGDWARTATPAEAVFLLPTHNLLSDFLAQKLPSEALDGLATFDYRSHRRVWIDFKRGAVVMWSPSYYPIWRERIDSVLQLQTLEAKLSYAAQNGVAYVVDECSSGNGQEAVFRSNRLCVFDSAASTMRPPPKS